MTDRILYLGENLQKDSHTEEFIHELRSYFKSVYPINYTTLYAKKGMQEAENHILKMLEEKRIDYIFFSPGESCLLRLNFFKEIRLSNEKIKLVTIFSDPEALFFENDIYYAQASDVAWIFNPAMKNIFESYQVTTIYGQLFDKEKYLEITKHDYEQNIEISFIGGEYRSNRREFIQCVEETYKNFYLAGFGTKKGWISTTKKNEIISRSKIHLNFSGVHSTQKGIHNRMTQLKGRLYEIVLLGSLPISEYGIGLDIRYRNEIPTFKNKKEMMDLIEFYIKNPDKRLEKIAKLKEIVNDEHNTEKIIGKLLSALKSSSSVLTYEQDTIFIRRFMAVRFYYLGFFILRPNKLIIELKFIFKHLKHIRIRMLWQIVRGFVNSYRGN